MPNKSKALVVVAVISMFTPFFIGLYEYARFRTVMRKIRKQTDQSYVKLYNELTDLTQTIADVNAVPQEVEEFDEIMRSHFGDDVVLFRSPFKK